MAKRHLSDAEHSDLKNAAHKMLSILKPGASEVDQKAEDDDAAEDAADHGADEAAEDEVEKAKLVPPAAADDAEPKPHDDGDQHPDDVHHGRDVTLEDILEVLNGLVEDVDNLMERVGTVEKFDAKYEQVGDLAKSLSTADEVAELRDSLGALSGTIETIAKGHEALSKRVDGIARTPQRSTAIPVENNGQVVAEALNKSIDAVPGDPSSTWSGMF